VNDDAMHGHGVIGRNSNILGKCQSKWRRAECDLVDDARVFLAKGCVVVCNPQETVLDDRLGEDHVGLCILYCLTIVSTMMTIWKWLLVQTILDGYPLIKHLISFNETHMLDVDDLGTAGV
jgi:hypothetical protein